MRLNTPVLIAGISLLASCGSDTASPSGDNNTTAPMSARINGTIWTATEATAVVSSNFIVINGSKPPAPNYTLAITVANVASTGAYPLGVNLTMFGGQALVSSQPLDGWATPLTGAAGEINITTLTASRVAGTFAFTATPLGTTTGNLTVNSGTFDLPLSGTLPVVPANSGSRVSGTINGTGFNAGTAAVGITSDASGTVSIAAGNLEKNLLIRLQGVTASGTYALSGSAVRQIQITGLGPSLTGTWGTQLSGGSGTVVITTFSASRIIGTFNGTLVPIGGGATGSLAVTGSFDMGRL